MVKFGYELVKFICPSLSVMPLYISSPLGFLYTTVVPDNFTKVQLNGRWLSYSKRCSLMGNGWNEPTVEWILSGLNS